MREWSRLDQAGTAEGRLHEQREDELFGEEARGDFWYARKKEISGSKRRE